MEIIDKMDSYARTEKERWKRKIRHDFILREVQAAYIGLEKGKKPPRPWDYYPELFEKEKEETEFAEYKERRRQYIEEFNRRRHLQ